MIRSVRQCGALLICWSAAVHAQDTVALTGIVADSAQSPLFGATVSIAGTHLSATTDPDGFFRISGIERAPQGLALSNTGFVSRVFRMDLTEVRGSTVDIGVLVLRPAVGDGSISGIVTDGRPSTSTASPCLMAISMSSSDPVMSRESRCIGGRCRFRFSPISAVSAVRSWCGPNEDQLIGDPRCGCPESSTHRCRRRPRRERSCRCGIGLLERTVAGSPRRWRDQTAIRR